MVCVRLFVCVFMCVVSLGKKRELLVRVVFEKTGCEMGEPEGSAARDLLPFTSCCVELGHSLGALGDGVLGELAGEDEADGRLDLAATECLRLREAADVGGLVADALEEVRDEVAHDSHALGRNARVRVHLLKDLVDVGGVRLLRLLLSFLTGGFLGRLGGLLGRGLGHCVESARACERRRREHKGRETRRFWAERRRAAARRPRRRRVCAAGFASISRIKDKAAPA